MSESILEIPLDIPEEVKDIVEHIEEIKAEEPEPPQSGVDAPASEEVKPVIKARAKGRPRGSVNKGPSSLGPRRFKYKRHLWKKSPTHTSPPLQGEILKYPPTQPPLMSQLPC